jgi:Protein of unknown function DUF262
MDASAPNDEPRETVAEGEADDATVAVAPASITEDPFELDEQDLAELADPDPEPERVSYSGTDFDVEGLVRRLDREDIVVPTFGHSDPTIEAAGFQRSFVWKRTQMDRFIESLLLGYPIPGIFLVQQADRRYLVLDGQQRLQTLADFYGGVHAGEPFSLQSVGQVFRGLTYATLTDEQRRQLDNTFIQATIVRIDGSRSSLEAVYQIFERLNSGGTQLTAHEIRVALYAGPLIEFLTELNADPNWRALYGPVSPRLRDQEIVLRSVALYVSPGTYKRPLKKYLNDFAADHRDLEGFPTDTVRARFCDASRLLVEGPGRAALRTALGRQVNAALTEAVLVGLARRLDTGPVDDPAVVGAAVDRLLAEEAFEQAVSRATADEESVRTRLALATREFASI